MISSFLNNLCRRNILASCKGVLNTYFYLITSLYTFALYQICKEYFTRFWRKINKVCWGRYNWLRTHPLLFLGQQSLVVSPMYVLLFGWVFLKACIPIKSLVEISKEKQSRRKFGHWRYLSKGVLGPCPFLIFFFS